MRKIPVPTAFHRVEVLIHSYCTNYITNYSQPSLSLCCLFHFIVRIHFKSDYIAEITEIQNASCYRKRHFTTMQSLSAPFLPMFPFKYSCKQGLQMYSCTMNNYRAVYISAGATVTRNVSHSYSRCAFSSLLEVCFAIGVTDLFSKRSLN